MLESLNHIKVGLSTYVGRDSCIRFTSYFFLFLYGLITEFNLKNKVNVLLYKNYFLCFKIMIKHLGILKVLQFKKLSFFDFL